LNGKDIESSFNRADARASDDDAGGQGHDPGRRRQRPGVAVRGLILPSALVQEYYDKRGAGEVGLN
jgi:hypothetical protein